MGVGDESLKEFVESVHKGVDEFMAKYQQKHEVNPAEYPIVLPENNAGLWLEFFVDYLTNGTV